MEKRHRLFKNGNFGHTQGHKNPCRYTYLYSFFAVGVKAEYYFDQIVEGMSAVQRTSEAHGIQKRGQLLCLLRIPNLLFCNISKFALLGVGNILQMLVQFQMIRQAIGFLIDVLQFLSETIAMRQFLLKALI